MDVPAHNSGKITPPSSLHSPLFTPLPSDEKQALDIRDIRRQIAKHQSERTGETILKVNKREWAILSPLLLREEKLRLDYFPSIELLVLRMPTILHEYFGCCLSTRIMTQLHLLSSGSGSAANFAKSIRPRGSATILPRAPNYGRHDPDVSFAHSQSLLSAVIIEIAYSQPEKKLSRLADEYILGSNLRIRVMVGVDIEYGHEENKRATFSVWRAKKQGPINDEVWVVEPTVANQIFRHGNGQPNIDPNAGLHLHLEDFADETTCRQFKVLNGDINGEIFVSCGELYQDLEEAARIMENIESSTPDSPQLRTRPRPKTPPEQLNERDENAFWKDEERVVKRQDLDDASYHGSSSESS